MKKVPAWVILCVIALVAGLALGLTNAFTETAIAEQNAADAASARTAVMTGAENFGEVAVPENTAIGDVTILSFYKSDAAATDCDEVVLVSVKGYGGDIEVTVGVAADGTITGISCGGGNFAETAGLGAKVKEAAFTEQFAGMTAPVALTKDGGDVDSVTAASRSSGAVCRAVNAAADYAKAN